MSHELVSVYIPTRNRAELLERALDSVLAQSYDTVEIIVCDDASTDSTPELLASYAETCKNIVCLRNEQPLGASASRNKAIFAARGKFITGLDDDDTFFPDRIQRFVEHYDPKWSCLADLPVFFDQSGEPRYASGNTRVVTLDDILYLNFMGNQVFCLTRLIQSVGGFNPAYPAFQDYELWTRLIARHGSALRIGAHTQCIYQNHGYQRISEGDSVERASDMYREEFGKWMKRSHHSAQRMQLRFQQPQLGRPRLVDLLATTASPVFREFLGLYLRSRFPTAIQRLSRIRRRAFAPERMP